ncbi:MAG: DUF1559 domain-containing protein [Planctomycetota bacterium]|nr:DUF1559 domain-containing protein [Planctomycetota bacterium]MDA1214721.1 DUF1559 domain-containing protein [Planctomycetota bacterium]
METDPEVRSAELPESSTHLRFTTRHVSYVLMMLLTSYLACGPMLLAWPFPHQHLSEFQKLMLPTYGVVPGVVVLLFWSAVWGMGFYKDALAKVVAGVFVLIVGLLLYGLVRPAVSSAREPARTTQCRNNLKQISLALNQYHDLNGSFPPAYIADDNGKPMHSWRVLLLPYLDEKNRYDQYHFDEPWDSANNQKLAKRTPGAYACLSTIQGMADDVETSYLAVTGPKTMWSGDKAVTLNDITDGLAKTIMLIELPQRAVNWIEPRDISVDEAVVLLSSLGAQDHERQFFNGHVMSCDNGPGQIRTIPEGLPAEAWSALFTINADDQTEEIKSFENCMISDRFKSYRILAWIGFMILALLPLAWITDPPSEVTAALRFERRR